MDIKKFLKSKWFIGSVILGMSFFISILLVKPIGVSTQYSITGGIIQNIVDENTVFEDDTTKTGYSSTNEYYAKSEGKIAKAIENPLNYDFIFVLAIPLGSFIASKMLDKNKNKKDEQESLKVKLPLKQKGRYFLSGFLLLFGARLAGGCTSGHMMSGMMQSSVSGYVFALVVFIVAIPTAILTKNKF